MSYQQISDYINYSSIQAADQGTWCELFKTKGYQRRVNHILKVRSHIVKMLQLMLKREGLDWEHWEIIRKGSNSKVEVTLKLNQRYEIVRGKE